MYLPRRDELADPRAPVSRSASIGGNGRRKSCRRSSARTMCRPVMLQRQAAADGFDFGKLGMQI